MKTKLKTLEEHNQNKWQAHLSFTSKFGQPCKNGIACPKCGEEMLDSCPETILTSNPPKKDIHCNCGYKGYRLV